MPHSSSKMEVGLLRRRCICGGHAVAAGEPAGCAKGIPQGAAANARPGSEVLPMVRDALRSPGQPLEGATRAFMESHLGHDFSEVRVHADGEAAASARAVNALAYTVGRDIVFGVGQYAPRTEAGRRMMAHELTHVVQQGGGRVEPASLRIGPTGDACERGAEESAARINDRGRSVVGNGARCCAEPAGILRRKPGENAQESWDSLVDVSYPEAVEPRGRAEEAVRRMLNTPSGAWLMNRLWTLFCGRGRGCDTRVTVRFVDRLPRGYSGDASGFFEPQDPDEPQYQVWVELRRPPQPGVIALGGSWPGGTSSDIHFTHTDAESDMAETLHHELLHVWFIHAQRDAIYPTGHANVLKNQIDPVFRERIRGFMGELDALESRIKSEAAAREREAAVPIPSVPDVEPRTRREAPQVPSRVGAEVSVHGGGGSVRGAGAAAGIVGADLALNEIYSLRLGARGVYLTPSHLLAGGTLGVRILQGQEEGAPFRPVENPLFFDLEAGVLAEVTAGDRDRLSKNIAAFGSAGVGQEFGRVGPRVFWRVGGFVIVSDRGEVAGGGTAGVGLRF